MLSEYLLTILFFACFTLGNVSKLLLSGIGKKLPKPDKGTKADRDKWLATCDVETLAGCVVKGEIDWELVDAARDREAMWFVNEGKPAEPPSEKVVQARKRAAAQEAEVRAKYLPPKSDPLTFVDCAFTDFATFMQKEIAQLRETLSLYDPSFTRSPPPAPTPTSTPPSPVARRQ